MERIHVPAAKLFPLLRVEGLGALLLMVARRVAPAVASLGARKAGRNVRPIDHQDLRRRITAVAFGCSLCRASRQVEQAVERFVGLDCRDLGSGHLASHCVPHPPLKPQPTGTLTPAGSWEGGWHENRPILSRRLPQKDAADACPKVHSSADWEHIHVERSLLQPGRVVDDGTSIIL